MGPFVPIHMTAGSCCEDDGDAVFGDDGGIGFAGDLSTDPEEDIGMVCEEDGCSKEETSSYCEDDGDAVFGDDEGIGFAGDLSTDPEEDIGMVCEEEGCSKEETSIVCEEEKEVVSLKHLLVPS
ncbi:hypothetical protein HHI36_004961 [Cryptolaemus montrouzieri]|uniref:Uncharacterized protein n=1 Tax=Cryptolaemus montrouzieri TaxID=559131 RepID=A0ABD2NTJ5_9CUCU